MNMQNKLLVPSALIVSSIILGGFYYAAELSKEESKIKTIDPVVIPEAKTTPIPVVQHKKSASEIICNYENIYEQNACILNKQRQEELEAGYRPTYIKIVD